MDYVTVPATGAIVYAGSVVTLARFPGTKWILEKGYYDMNGYRYMGWHFTSIPAKTVLPVTAEYLNEMSVVSGGDAGCPCPPPRPPFPPYPPIPPTPPTPGGDTPGTTQFNADRAFITVSSMYERDALVAGMSEIPEGKVVKVVDDGEGHTKYFTWDGEAHEWVEEFFGIDASNFVEKVGDFEAGTIPSFDENGNLVESGLKAGGLTLSEEDDTELLAKEMAVKDALSWEKIEE